jgi:hypothetical protein
MAEPLRHRQTKGAETDMFYLTPSRHISTLPEKDETDEVNIDPEMGDRSRAIGFRVAYVTFILSYGLIIARFGLWGLLFGARALVAGRRWVCSRRVCFLSLSVALPDPGSIFAVLACWP